MDLRTTASSSLPDLSLFYLRSAAVVSFVLPSTLVHFVHKLASIDSLLFLHLNTPPIRLIELASKLSRQLYLDTILIDRYLATGLKNISCVLQKPHACNNTGYWRTAAPRQSHLDRLDRRRRGRGLKQFGCNLSRQVAPSTR